MKEINKGLKKCIVLFCIIFFIYLLYNFLTQDYIKNYDVSISTTKNGKIVVNESLEYVLHNNDTELILPINVILHNNIFESNITTDNSIYKYINKIEDLNLIVNKSDKYSIKDVEFVRISKGYVGVKLPYNYDKGTLNIDFSYNINNSVCNFNDVSQLYLKFSNKSNLYKYKNFNITFNLSKFNAKNLNLYAYDDERIYSSSSNSGLISYYNSNIGKKSDFNIRLLFKSNKANSGTYIDFDALPILEEQMNIYNDNLNNEKIFVIFLIVIIILLIIYYVFLLLKYDYNKIQNISAFSYDEIVEKINPVIAACLVGERQFDNKDILAIITSIIAKGYIKVEKYSRDSIYHKLMASGISKKDIEDKLIDSSDEIFELSKVKNVKNNIKLDELEDRIFDIIFREDDVVLLHDRLNEIRLNPIYNNNIKGIKEYVNEYLFNLGAKVSPPRIVFIFNFIIFFIVMILCSNIIINNYNANKVVKDIFYLYNFGQYNFWENIIMLLEKVIKVLFIVAIIELLLYIITYFIYFIVYIFDRVIRGTVKYILKEEYGIFDGKSLISIVATLNKGLKTLNVMALIILILYLIIPNYITILAMIPIAISAIIFNSTFFMKKNSNECEKLYVGIYILFDKLKNASLLSEKKFKDNVLWNKYLAFSLAFGISNDESFEYYNKIDTEQDLKDICNYMISNSYYFKNSNINNITNNKIKYIKKIISIIIAFISIILSFCV